MLVCFIPAAADSGLFTSNHFSLCICLRGPALRASHFPVFKAPSCNMAVRRGPLDPEAHLRFSFLVDLRSQFSAESAVGISAIAVPVLVVEGQQPRPCPGSSQNGICGIEGRFFGRVVRGFWANSCSCRDVVLPSQGTLVSGLLPFAEVAKNATSLAPTA